MSTTETLREESRGVPTRATMRLSRLVFDEALYPRKEHDPAITTSTITVTLSINVPDTCCPNLWKASKHKVPYVIKHMECHGRIHTGITIADRAKDERGEHHRHGPKRWVTPPMPEHKHERSDQVCQCQPSPCPVSPGLLRQLPLQNAPKGQFFGAWLPQPQGEESPRENLPQRYRLYGQTQPQAQPKNPACQQHCEKQPILVKRGRAIQSQYTRDFPHGYEPSL